MAIVNKRNESACKKQVNNSILSRKSHSENYKYRKPEKATTEES